MNQPLVIRKLRLGINDSQMQLLLTMAMQSGSINVADYLQNSHTPYKGNKISALAFINILRNGQGNYAPNWPVELLEYPNLYEYVGNDPLNGIDPFGLWTLGGVWDTFLNWLEGTWEAIQEGLMPDPAGIGVGILEAAPDIYNTWTNQPPKCKFGDDPVNNPVPPTAG